MATNQTYTRISSLDGLRGSAALVVVFFHSFAALSPQLEPGLGIDPLPLIDNPFAFLWNGLFAVSIFFVMSGFVIAASAPGRPWLLPLTIILRYLRLAIPAGFSCVFAMGLLLLLPDALDAFRALSPSNWLQYSYSHVEPAPIGAFKEGAISIFVTGSSLYNNVLWTMKVELIGSVAVYLISTLPDRCRSPILLLWFLSTLALREFNYIGFSLGALMFRHRPTVTSSAAVALLFAGSLMIGGLFAGIGDRLGWTFPFAYEVGKPAHILSGICAALTVYSVLRSRWIAEGLSSRPFQYLGHISFSLYLVHVPIVYTIGSAMAVQFWPLGPLKVAFMVIVIVAVSLFSAHFFTAWIERPVLAVLKAIRNANYPMWVLP